MNRLLTLFLLAFSLTSVAAPTVKKTTPAAAPARRGPTDAELESAIRAKLAKSKISQKSKFTVHVQNGVAILEGQTNVIQHKGVATRLAHTAGALQVKNNIQISEAAREKAIGNLNKPRKVQVKGS